MPVRNAGVAEIQNRTTEFLEIEGANPFRVRAECDEVVCMAAPADFGAISIFYADCPRGWRGARRTISQSGKPCGRTKLKFRDQRNWQDPPIEGLIPDGTYYSGIG